MGLRCKFRVRMRLLAQCGSGAACANAHNGLELGMLFIVGSSRHLVTAADWLAISVLVVFTRMACVCNMLHVIK